MIIRQPNGDFLIWDFLSGSIEINVSKEKIMNIYLEQAKKRAEKDMQEAKGLDYILKNEIEYGKVTISENDLKEMGINIPKAELIKKVTLKPKNKKYIGCDFTTWAECPNCKAKVYNGISGTQTKCNKCGQMLDWKSDY